MLLFTLGTESLVFCIITLILAGTVKGILGIGLPLVAVPILATFFDLPTAIALMILPIMASNITQAWEGKRNTISIKRFVSLLITLIPCTIFAAQYLTTINIKTGSVILGSIVVIFSLSKFLKLNFNIKPKAESILSPIVGIISGLIGGVSSLIGPVIAMYFVSLKMQKDVFVGTIAIVFLFFATTLYTTMAINGTLNLNNIYSSVIISFPVMAGVFIGNKVRKLINLRTFEIALTLCLILIGLNLIRKGLF